MSALDDLLDQTHKAFGLEESADLYVGAVSVRAAHSDLATLRSRLSALESENAAMRERAERAEMVLHQFRRWDGEEAPYLPRAEIRRLADAALAQDGSHDGR